MTTTLTPYLNFDGKAEEAMKLYAEIFGGKLEIMRMGDAPDQGVKPEDKQRVMHAALMAPTLKLFASDTMSGQRPMQGDAVHLTLNFDDKSEQQRVWDRLAAGGKVTMPLGDVFFGRFGMLTDEFGTPWMLQYASAKS